MGPEPLSSQEDQKTQYKYTESIQAEPRRVALYELATLYGYVHQHFGYLVYDSLIS